jgi:hypothetical protein
MGAPKLQAKGAEAFKVSAKNNLISDDVLLANAVQVPGLALGQDQGVETMIDQVEEIETKNGATVVEMTENAGIKVRNQNNGEPNLLIARDRTKKEERILLSKVEKIIAKRVASKTNRTFLRKMNTEMERIHWQETILLTSAIRMKQLDDCRDLLKVGKGQAQSLVRVKIEHPRETPISDKKSQRSLPIG